MTNKLGTAYKSSYFRKSKPRKDTIRTRPKEEQKKRKERLKLYIQRAEMGSPLFEESEDLR